MSKFVLIYHGHETPTPETRDAWNSWFRRRASHFVDVGYSFGPGRHITDEMTIEFSLSSNPASGYSIVDAEHLDAAEQVLERCPIVDSVTIYPVIEPDSVDFNRIQTKKEEHR